MGQEKLSPPLVTGTIPAFYANSEGIVITIPFTMNRVVGLSQISGYAVKIKTIQSGTTLYSKEIYERVKDELKFTIPADKMNKFRVGQYYKIQLAYIGLDGTIGYYSTVTVGKYTIKPILTIQSLNADKLNSHLYTYEGIYRQQTVDGEDGDITERAYSYQFEIYDSDGSLVDSSGWLLHNSDCDDKDEPYESRDEYTFTQDLAIGRSYRVIYSVITNNNLEISSPRYRVTQKRSISPELSAQLLVSLNYDNGYISVDLKSLSDIMTINELVTGFFIVSRASEDTNYSVWEEVHRFKLTAQFPTIHLCKDFTIEQGKNYKYSIQQYNNVGLRSNRILSDVIYADFEDAFLYDGKRQLKIRYNPKISSFKKDLLEQKTDTIGGKHPFIFRNGRVYYSEFPISGLISYQMDEENLFLSEEDYGLTEKTTNLVSENIAAERMFKMKVLEWLTNGEPKIYRSPAEGNFIVRLMNSSLSPNDTLGRMLHTFSSTAYEIADFNYSNLGEMGFISVDDMTSTSLQWETKNLRGSAVGKNLLENPIRTVRFDDMIPGEVIGILFKNHDEYEQIKIGITGSYYVDTGVDITGIQLYTEHNNNGSITYSYNCTVVPTFETVANVDVMEMPGHQFIGEHNILQELLYVKNDGEWIKNPKLELVEIYNIQVEKRPLQRIDSFEDDPFLMYEYGEWIVDEEGGSRPGYPKKIFKTLYYYDGEKGFNAGEPVAQYKQYEPYIKLNDTVISVNEIEETSYVRPGAVNELISGNGCLVTMSYQMCNITYNIEIEAESITDPNHYLYKLGTAIYDYKTALANLELNLEVGDAEAIENARLMIDETYTAYIVELISAQEEDLRRRGVIE